MALGPERTRNELLPYILELLEDDEEVLCTLADVLGEQLSNVGGAAQADHLLKVLERLCSIEEIAVREKVTSCALNLKFRQLRALRRSWAKLRSRTSSSQLWD